jgi:hypothetical protein
VDPLALEASERIFAESWSERGVHAVHLGGVWARMLIAVYSGTALAAMPVVEAALKRVKRSLLLRVETLRLHRRRELSGGACLYHPAGGGT